MGERTLPHIKLEPLDPDDAVRVYDLVDAERRHLETWLDWVPACKSPEHVRAFIEEARTRPFPAAWAIQRGEDLAGVLAVNQFLAATRTATLGYWLARNQQGQGLARAAVHAASALLLAHKDIDAVWVCILPDNKRSLAVPRALGFTDLGLHAGRSRQGTRGIYRVFERRVEPCHART